MENITMRPDAKGRINLGELANGISSYRVTKGENGILTLYPYVEIPLNEKWVFDNKDILEKVKEQFKDKGDNDVV